MSEHYSLIAASFRTSEGGACDGSPFTPRHYHLKLDYGLPTERTVSFATQAERLAAAKATLRAERSKP